MDAEKYILVDCSAGMRRTLNHAVHLEALQELAVRISGERSVDAVLQSIVHGLAQQPSVALARVWVTEPGDVCGSCRMRTACPDQTACLHLSASAGTSLTGEQWSRTDGTFRRVPFGNSSMEFCPVSREGNCDRSHRTAASRVRVQPVGPPRLDSAGNHRELCGPPTRLSWRHTRCTRRVPPGAHQRAGVQLAADVCEPGGGGRRKCARVLRTRQAPATAGIAQCVLERGDRQRLELRPDRGP